MLSRLRRKYNISLEILHDNEAELFNELVEHLTKNFKWTYFTIDKSND